MVALLRGPGLGSRDVTFSRDGDATVEQGQHRWYAKGDRHLMGVVISAGGAPLGADLVCDVLLDAFDGGGTMYTTSANRPIVAAGAHEGVSPAPDVVLVPDGHYVTVDIVQTGLSPNPGSKIDVRVLYF